MARFSQFDIAHGADVRANGNPSVSFEEALKILGDMRPEIHRRDQRLWGKGQITMKEARRRSAALDLIKAALLRARCDHAYYSSVPAPRP